MFHDLLCLRIDRLLAVGVIIVGGPGVCPLSNRRPTFPPKWACRGGDFSCSDSDSSLLGMVGISFALLLLARAKDDSRLTLALRPRFDEAARACFDGLVSSSISSS